MELQFEQFLQDFGGMDTILSVCDIDPVKVLMLMYEDGMFNPEDLTGVYEGE